jgi:hypothetical protein
VLAQVHHTNEKPDLQHVGRSSLAVVNYTSKLDRSYQDLRLLLEMPLFETLFYHFQVALVNFALLLSRFEAEYLQILLSVRIFSTGTDPNLRYHEAFLFFVALLHALIDSPLTDLAHWCIHGNREPSYELVACVVAERDHSCYLSISGQLQWSQGRSTTILHKAN